MLRKYNFRLYRFLKPNLTTKTDKYRVLILAYLYIIAIVPSIMFTIIHFFQNIYSSTFINFTNSTVFIIGFYYLTKRNYLISKYIIMVTAIIAIALNAAILGKEAGNYVLMFPLFSTLFVLFDSKEIKHITCLFILIILSLVFIEINDHRYLYNSNVDPNYVAFSFYFVTIFSFLLQFFILYVLVYMQHYFEKKANEGNIKLIKKNKNLIIVNHELDSFVYKTSHDLRAPLSSILGLINLIKISNNQDDINNYLSLQEVSVTKLDNTIKDILNISKNTRSEVQVTKCDLLELIHSCFNELAFMKNADFVKLKIESDIQADFHSDTNRLKIIFSNILSNCIKYLDFNKHQNIVEIFIKVEPNKVQISIKDNGLGIEANSVSKIFNMFYRANSEIFGSGLGLYIVKETLRKIEGTIAVSTSYRHWTQFDITLKNYILK
ncbi:MAG: sensor histidine kinase [Cytophagales bacterium]|nr:MAG: sensor histidine kinase [Cytophagales bacterium]